MKVMKLWHWTEHVFTRSRQSSVGGRRCSPGRHGTLAFKSHRHDRVHTLGDQRTPGGLVAQLGSIGYPRAMAGNASRFVQLLSGGMPRCLACACNSHRFCCGGSSSLFLDLGLQHSGAFLGDEIGRASCRERVCKYVLVSVVAVLFKKKKT